MKDDPAFPVSQLDLKIYRKALKVSQRSGKTVLFDPIRRQHVAASPEELVRQLAIRWLIEHYKLGRGRIIVEKQLTTGLRERRFDLAVLDQNMDPWLLVECKAPEVPLTEKVWLQASLYNRTMGAPFIWITNGHAHRIGQWDLSLASFQERASFPPAP